MEAKFNTLWTTVQKSARNFAGKSLELSVKAVGTTASRLKAFEETLKVRAEKLHNKPAAEAPAQK